MFSEYYKLGFYLIVSLMLVPIQLLADEPYLLSGDLVELGDVFDHKVSPDGKWIVFRADKEVEGKFELYSVPTIGGTPIKISGEMIAAGDVSSSYKISPDSSRVVFRADKTVNGEFELYRASISANSVILLSKIGQNPFSLLRTGHVSNEFEISPYGSRVVYSADKEADGQFGLYSVRIIGPTGTLNGVTITLPIPDPIIISPSLTLTNDAINFQISSSSSQVVFKAVDNDVTNLYRVSIVGDDEPFNVSGLQDDPVAIPEGHLDFKISPDGSRVVYMAEINDAKVELYSASMANNILPSKISALHFFDLGIQSFEISPNSSRVVFKIPKNPPFNRNARLYSVHTSGGDQINIGGSLVPEDDAFKDFQISPDSSRVAFRIKNISNDVTELYSVQITDDNPQKLSANSSFFFPALDVASGYKVSSDSNYVVYSVEKSFTVKDLYSVPINSGGSKLLGGNVASDFKISPDSSSVVFQSSTGILASRDLFFVPITGGEKIEISALLDSSGITDFSVSNSLNGTHVAYIADQVQQDKKELFAYKIPSNHIVAIMPIMMFLLLNE